MNNKLISIALVLSLVAGCQSVHTSTNQVSTVKADLSESQEKIWKKMIGRWYGSQPTKEGGTRQQITERYSDGTYKITIKNITKSGELNISSEVGQWGVVARVYFSIFRGWITENGIVPSDPSDPYNYDAYEILELTDESFKYKSYSSGTIYSLKKVENDFEFPNI